MAILQTSLSFTVFYMTFQPILTETGPCMFASDMAVELASQLNTAFKLIPEAIKGLIHTEGLVYGDITPVHVFPTQVKGLECDAATNELNEVLITETQLSVKLVARSAKIPGVIRQSNVVLSFSGSTSVTANTLRDGGPTYLLDVECSRDTSWSQASACKFLKTPTNEQKAQGKRVIDIIKAKGEFMIHGLGKALAEVPWNVVYASNGASLTVRTPAAMAVGSGTAAIQIATNAKQKDLVKVTAQVPEKFSEDLTDSDIGRLEHCLTMYLAGWKKCPDY